MVDNDAEIVWWCWRGSALLYGFTLTLWVCDPATHHNKKERTFQKVNAKSNKSVRVVGWKTIYTLEESTPGRSFFLYFNMKNGGITTRVNNKHPSRLQAFHDERTRISKSNRESVRVKQRDLNSKFQIHIFDVLEGAAHEWIMMMLMILIPNNINLMKKSSDQELNVAPAPIHCLEFRSNRDVNCQLGPVVVSIES